MNGKIRQKLMQRLATKAGIITTKSLNYKDCQKIADHLDCDANTIARLADLPNFKATQTLKPDIEQKIADFLGYKSYENLEMSLMIDVVTDYIKVSLCVLLVGGLGYVVMNTT
jgi:hypothetical protein